MEEVSTQQSVQEEVTAMDPGVTETTMAPEPPSSTTTSTTTTTTTTTTPPPDMAAAYSNFFKLWNAEAARNSVAPQAFRAQPLHRSGTQVAPPKAKSITQSTTNNRFVPLTSSWGQQGALPLIIVLPSMSQGTSQQLTA